MNAMLLLALLSAPGPLLMVPNASGLTSSGSSGVSCFHDADNSVSMCVLTSDTLGLSIYGKNRTDDANGLPMVIKPESVSPFAAAAKTAPDLLLAGGSDSKTVVFTPAGANPDTGGLCTAADTVIVTANGAAVGTCTYTTYCAAGCATRNAAAVALAGCIDAFALVGASVGTQAGGVADTVGVTGDAPTTTIVLSQNDATCTAISNGTNGCVRLGTAVLSPEPSLWGAGGIGLGTTCGGTNAAFYAGTISSSNSVYESGGTGYMHTDSEITPTGIYGYVSCDKKGGCDKRVKKQLTITFAGGGEASKCSLAAIPVGATSLKLSCRNIVANTGAATSYDAGAFVGDNSYGSLIAGTLSTTFVSPYSYDSYPVAGDICLSAVGGNAAALSVRCTYSYFIDSADTSN